jgi:8-oxo-dGTP pyrophosphatase MutT (NUDIX family)
MKKSVNVVIENGEGELLVLKRVGQDEFYPGYWNFPDGGVEPGKESVAAAMREAEEEAGLAMKPEGRYFAVYCYPDGKEENAEAAAYAFKATTISSAIHLDSEHTDYRWVSKENWRNLACTPSCKAILEGYFP